MTKKKVFEEIKVFVLMLLVVSSLRSALADWNDVPTGSMKPTIQEGDRVVVNTTAVDLGLGTGGSDIVHWNLARDAWSEPGPGHVMKLRYTSLQVDTGSTEELESYEPRAPLAAAPVVACALHSQVACVAAAFRHLAPARQ